VDVFLSWLPSLFEAALTTVWLTVRVLAIATAVGVVFGAALANGPALVRLLLRVYVDTMRGIPILVLLYTAFFVATAVGLNFDAVTAAIIGLSMFATAHVAEIVRGGFQSLSRTTIESSQSIGLTAVQRFRLVTVPMLLPRVIPPWVNTAVEVMKATSLASLIGVRDLIYATQSAAAPPRDPMPFYVFAAAVYFIIGSVLSRVGRAVERRFRYLEY
jgi:polar amino acid transport system permease protein